MYLPAKLASLYLEPSMHSISINNGLAAALIDSNCFKNKLLLTTVLPKLL